MSLTLYTYFRSSASYRVRIALALKGLSYESVPVNLLKGEQKNPDYAKLNPQKKVPALVDGKHFLTQSLAIIEYLEETHPNPPLLPKTPHERARVRALAQTIAGDIAPLNNVGPLKFLTEKLGVSEDGKNQWYAHWIADGFAALEQILSSGAGTYCHGDRVTLADCVLVPQVFNARRYNVDLSPYPTIIRIDAALNELPAFQAAHPSKQKDAA